MTALPSYPNPRLRGWALAPGVPRPTVWYRLWRRVFQAAFISLWKIRVFNRHYEPADGPVLYLCNHQSYLDPPLMSLALRRPMNYMARDSLFRNPIFRRLIVSWNAFPVRRATADRRALTEALRRLRRGQQVAMWPESTRTRDGRIGRFLPGAALLAKRAARWTVPVLIDGGFECWPRARRLPRPGRIVVVYGEPVSAELARDLEAGQFMELVRGRIIALQTDLRRRLGRSPLGGADGL